MNSYDEALTLGICIGAAIAGLAALACWMKRDEIQGPLPVNEDWPERPSQPQPELTAGQCMTCRRVRCLGGRWLHEATVTLPAGCRVSHGLCPSCERRAHSEIDAITIANRA